MPRRRRYSAYWEPPPPRVVNSCRTLLVIDNRPLQAAAWAELVRARKRLEKATRDVHRHEEADEPGFRAWLATTFPTLISAVRELAERFEARRRMVQAVENEAYFTGRSPGQIWREWQQNGGQPPPAPPNDEESENEDDPRAQEDPFADLEAAFEEEMKRMFGEEDTDEEDPFANTFRDFARGVFGFGRTPEPRPEVPEAREVYRRLVRHLHPDRGGEWTPARARLWEIVQEAWSARDADWLSRIEAEWEASNDMLSPASPVSRLRAALVEIDAARRDAERRVRMYRKQDAWRFSLQTPSQALRDRIQRHLARDESILRAQVEEVETVIARWERTASRPQVKRRRVRAGQREFGF